MCLSVYQAKPYVELKHPEWAESAVIYQVNIRHFTKEGTFEAFRAHLPRLKDLGVDILWLMPIHPIGELNRKGSLGSPYAVKDYYAVNAEFGTAEDLHRLINDIHALGMFVILDWVANHSAWDNSLTQSHPEWYSKNKQGNFQPTPWYDWDDIIEFDYTNPGLRQYMTEAMKYWVINYDIDGFRCDVAGFVPTDFWNQVRFELDMIKPVFMLAEWESRDLHQKAFDMTYGWNLWDKLLAVANGRGYNRHAFPVLVEYMAHDVKTFPRDAYRMLFTDNHDKNAWEGNQYLNFADALGVATVMTVLANGMPLVYSGQEAGLDRSLAFFDKDFIEWKPHPNAELYRTLFSLKHKNRALRNGQRGGEMIRIPNSGDKILSFYRESDGDRAVAILNFSDKRQMLKLQCDGIEGIYIDWFSQRSYQLEISHQVEIEPWGYIVLSQHKIDN
ncbi:alpha-amylase family glycosyl hydrolase [Bisgaard Taxon 10/6]|uniref:alpha-amylase family glycosyl hydrolase n=1 Tax=Exercitatus varius TaxID=67857 RepID=UPI00294ABD9A|nr:alpha-amylase family glycosyl hydrolase [Exercitatus varius]MDG2956593.1 alpha-amylase family glycosyl hydrolase [Exercitatus varius]MDG2964438.1 alpha-amylase family glycosyl hydrolase [Exercitatus varius]